MARPLRLTAGALLLAGAAAAPAATTVVGDGLVLSCTEPKPIELRCDYRLTRAGQPLAASARVRDLALPAPSFAARTGAPGRIAILLLVDTSDPGRAAAMERIRAHIARLVEGGEAHQRFGLAAFDSELRMLAPIGSPPQTIRAAAAELQASGATTELYRNVVEAVKLLATASGEHRLLVVLSDGLAEDRAYFHRDAVQAALASRIAIFGIGYPRSPSLAVGLQSLRRLAEETGGRYVASDLSFRLPEAFFDAPFAAVEYSGALSVDLSAAAEALPGGEDTVRIALETSAGPVSARVPITLPLRSTAEPVVKVVEVEVPKVVEVERVVEVPVTSPPPSQQPPRPAGAALWYWVGAIGLLALALLALLLVLLVLRRGDPSPAATPAARTAPAAPPLPAGLAWLFPADGGEPHPINSATFRIGRLADNDLVLRDPSVSRHHAEIRRRRDGSFQLLDLDSMNGVLVNGKRVREGELADQDVLEVGDVRLTFTLAPAANLAGEETVMLRTGLPEQPFPETAGSPR